MRTITYAPDAWKYLNGLFCIYKPPNLPLTFARQTIVFNLCRDLNDMKKRPPKDLVLLKGSLSTGQPFSVEVATNYADSELVTGQRYQIQDLRMIPIDPIGKHASGVVLFAINDGCKMLKTLGTGTFLCKYEVKGRFGLATDNFMTDGKVVERTTFSHIRRGAMDRLLASIQFSHQALSFKYSGLDPQSQEAYELASKGLVRPVGQTKPIIYSLKCSKFTLPEFTLEMHCINETEVFLAEFVHQLGLYLKSNAVCTGLRRSQFGHFTSDIALLRKHWTLENVLSNITLCQKIYDRGCYVPTSPKLEIIKPSKLNEAIEDMQNEVKKDVL